MSPKSWFPLESNPSVMNAYMKKLGMNTDMYSFHDVFSTEDWALEMVPRPVLAVLMLFPITESSEKYAEEEQTRIQSNGQIVSENMVYIQQTIDNACGTIGLLHAACNAQTNDLIVPDSYLSRFISQVKTKSPSEIAQYLEDDSELEATHESAAGEGQTEQTGEDVDTHFICFRYINSTVILLDFY